VKDCSKNIKNISRQFLRLFLRLLPYNDYRVIHLKKHFNSYEQYCCVLEKNIIMQETVYHNGTKSIVCTNLPYCEDIGGCKNAVLRRLWEAVGID